MTNTAYITETVRNRDISMACMAENIQKIIYIRLLLFTFITYSQPLPTYGFSLAHLRINLKNAKSSLASRPVKQKEQTENLWNKTLITYVATLPLTG